jgi:hypothetical protein
MPSKSAAEPVEVWLWDPSARAKPFDHAASPLEYLPTDAPLPRAGDILVLPTNLTGDDKHEAFAYAGTRTPFAVVQCEHIYHRSDAERHGAIAPKPARHVKTLVFVRRMSQKEFYEDRGWSRESAD